MVKPLKGMMKHVSKTFLGWLNPPSVLEACNSSGRKHYLHGDLSGHQVWELFTCLKQERDGFEPMIDIHRYTVWGICVNQT